MAEAEGLTVLTYVAALLQPGWAYIVGVAGEHTLRKTSPKRHPTKEESLETK
ncbi:hypothetical protein BDW68DRAFT_180793 [Aspergillus falconensis]